MSNNESDNVPVTADPEDIPDHVAKQLTEPTFHQKVRQWLRYAPPLAMLHNLFVRIMAPHGWITTSVITLYVLYVRGGISEADLYHRMQTNQVEAFQVFHRFMVKWIGEGDWDRVQEQFNLPADLDRQVEFKLAQLDRVASTLYKRVRQAKGKVNVVERID